MSSAIFSDDRIYRYKLVRNVSMADGTVAFIMINPSTADEKVNDPTIRKCLGFAERWGFGRLLIGNLLAYRAADIKDLAKAKVGLSGLYNDSWLDEIIRTADKVVVAWGTLEKIPGTYRHRWYIVTSLAEKHGKKLYCLSTCLDGHPRHPLFVSYTTELEEWIPKK